MREYKLGIQSVITVSLSSLPTMTAMSSSTKAEQYKQAVEWRTDYTALSLPLTPCPPLQGNAAFAKHDLDLALANFTTAIQLDPSIAAFPLNRAAVHLRLKEWTRAEKDATTALELDGGVNLKAWFRRAVARRNLGNLELAKQGKVLPPCYPSWGGGGDSAHSDRPSPADLEEAKRHGAGADVDAELALVLQQLGPAAESGRRHDKDLEANKVRAGRQSRVLRNSGWREKKADTGS